MALSRGTRLGPYEIVSPLGAGGMGDVYRARDPKPGRDVAIKIPSHRSTTDSERLGRFEREARMLAALNHSNLGAIYDLFDVTEDGKQIVFDRVRENSDIVLIDRSK